MYKKEKDEGLRAGTKLTSKHIYYENQKMNVRLAAQVLSTSVSDALLFTKTKDSSFDGCSATAEFCLMFNNAFDIMLVRNYQIYLLMEQLLKIFQKICSIL